MKRRKLKRIIETFPRISTSSLRILDLISNEKTSIADLFNVVEVDSALTARLLQIVNSPVYGMISPVLTVRRALPLLGMRTLACIVLDESMGDTLRKPLPGYLCKENQLWKHDLRVAVASREIARLNHEVCHPDVAFTCGLLHDIGKIVMSTVLQEHEAMTTDDEELSFVEREYALADLSHTELGAELVSSWKLPKIFQEVILYHHEPSRASEDHRPIVFAVHLGDILSLMSGFGTGIDNLYYKLDRLYSNYLDIDETALPKLMIKIDEEYEALVQAMAQ